MQVTLSHFYCSALIVITTKRHIHSHLHWMLKNFIGINSGRTSGWICLVFHQYSAKIVATFSPHLFHSVYSRLTIQYGKAQHSSRTSLLLSVPLVWCFRMLAGESEENPIETVVLCSAIFTKWNSAVRLCVCLQQKIMSRLC